MSSELLANSIRIWNLLKLHKENKKLDGLSSLSEVYDLQADTVDEIEYYHNNKNKLRASSEISSENKIQSMLVPN